MYLKYVDSVGEPLAGRAKEFFFCRSCDKAKHPLIRVGVSRECFAACQDVALSSEPSNPLDAAYETGPKPCLCALELRLSRAVF